ncbi:MAG: TetR/AcrR family transcriptional regulator [Sphingopyxis sp.]|nr:TetR/AcrR family transcriptional regulator [Sphingopyxis sp.]
MPDLNFSVLRFVPREGGYARGQEGFELILKTAVSVLVEHGYKDMTLRRIAKECGMKAGNISYYFKSKDDLVRALLQAISGSYETAISEATAGAGGDPESKLTQLISFILQDGTTRQTSYLFPELWSLANHDTFAKQCVDELYLSEHQRFDEIIGELNPALSADDRSVLSTFILSSIEGIGVFAGYGKYWQDAMPQLQATACRCFLEFVKSAKPGVSGTLSASAPELKP